MWHGHGRSRFGRHGLRRRLRFGLQRKLFVWAVGTILFTLGATLAVVHWIAPASPFKRDMADSARNFAAASFAGVWHDPAARRTLAEQLSRSFELDVELYDAGGRELLRLGEGCTRAAHISAPVLRAGEQVGTLEACFRGRRRAFGWSAILGVATACATLLFASALLAKRLARPLAELSEVAKEIGAGRLKSRARLRRGDASEAGELADAINDMASRIERQLEDQRELLAVVSHELRSPLSRLRVLVELAQERGTGPDTLREIEREILGIDLLVGKLLASSRLDFEALERQELSARALAERALERAGLPAELLRDASGGARLMGDATLLERALGNLIENALRHAGQLEALNIGVRRERVVFDVCDRGPGFDPATLPQVFQRFFRAARGSDAVERSARRAAAANHTGTLGLGLSLVDRIARAHGGSARAENRPNGGARVLLAIPLAPGQSSAYSEATPNTT